MGDAPEALLLDLVEWIAASPRPYADAIDRWRTSCPRLTVWEDALDRGFIRRTRGDHGALVVATAEGEAFLRGHARNIAVTATEPLPVSHARRDSAGLA